MTALPPQTADVAIVGAGFAGLACAQATARRGLRTLVLDRKPEAGVRVHTTGLLVKEVADEWDVPLRLTRKIRGVRLYAPSLDHVDLVSPGYFFLATDTGALLRWWADEARRAGARVAFGHGVREARPTPAGFRLEPHGLSARQLVAADGARSRVARQLGLGRNGPMLLGLESEFEGVEGVDPDRLHVFLDSEIAPGYIAWVVPGVGITQVGLACHAGSDARLARFRARLAELFDFSRAREVGRRAGPIPVGGAVRPMGRPGALLVGDAAGLVSPLTAGGIHTAIHYGRRAGLAVCDHLLDGGQEPWRVMQRAAPSFAAKRLLRFAFDRRPPNALYDVAVRSPVFRAVARTVFFHHRGLLSREAWRDLAASLAAR